MKGKFIAASAALAFALGTSVPALAADCDASTTGIQSPGSYISSVAKANNGLSNWSPFQDALNGTADTTLATSVNGTTTDVVTDGKKGLGGDMQNLLGIACGVGSKRADHATLP
jgi:hypothetical protein